MQRPELVAVVSVPQERSVRCQGPDCGRQVYARIHIVLEQGNLCLYGSTCFSRLFGHEGALGAARFGAYVEGGLSLSASQVESLHADPSSLIAELEQLRAEEAAAAVRWQANLKAREVERQQMEAELARLAAERQEQSRRAIETFREAAMEELRREFQLSQSQILSIGWQGLVAQRALEMARGRAEGGLFG